MNIVDKIKEKIIKKNRYYYKKYDDYTNTLFYYEIIAEKGKGPVSCKIVDSIPSNSECVDYNDIDTHIILDMINRTTDEYLSSISYNESFFESSLYDLPIEQWAEKEPNYYNKYVNSLNMVKEVVSKNGISVPSENEVVYKIIDIINSREKKVNKKFEDLIPAKKIVLDRIDDEYKDTISNGKYDAVLFEFYHRMIMHYVASFWDNYPIFSNIIRKDKLNDNDKDVVSRYYEFLIGLPELLKADRHIIECSNKVAIEKRKASENRFKSNEDFLTSINNLISFSDRDKEDLYIHATKDLRSSKSIIENGLYTFGEMDSFCFPFESINQILKYEYGSSFSLYDNYVVVFRLPKDSFGPDKISEEEASMAVGSIDMRRSGLYMKPTGKIKPSDILGVIDKKNMRVIENPNFEVLSNGRTR